jgi:hypothetical protein
LARSASASLREGTGLILGGVALVTLLAVVIGSFGASYDARIKVAFPKQPRAIAAHLSPPARELRSDAVTRDLERELRARGADPGGLAGRLLVLQRSDDGAELVAEGHSRGAATGLVINWADSFIAVRTAAEKRTLGRLRRAAVRDHDLRRLALIDAVGAQLPDVEVVRGTVLSGYDDLVPWPAPLAGLLLGAALALWRGTRRRSLRTAEDARLLGPPVLARLGSGALDGFGPELRLLASKLVIRGGGGGAESQALLVTALDGVEEPAERLAAALEAGAGARVRVEPWPGTGARAGDAWLGVITLGSAGSAAAAERLAAGGAGGRAPDGLVVVA